MQQFIRTVNTTDAFKMKMEQLEKEYQVKLKQINGEITRLDAEMDKHAVKGVGGEIGGGFLRFISWVAFVPGGISLIFFIIGIFSDTTKDSLPLAIGLLIFGILMFILGDTWRRKGNRMLNTAYTKQMAAEKLINQIEREISDLRVRRSLMEAQLQAEMNHQKIIFQQHMMNQQELIEQEVSAINAIKKIDLLTAATSEDTKECPQCAEFVKFRAKICRFCNYQFPQ